MFLTGMGDVLKAHKKSNAKQQICQQSILLQKKYTNVDEKKFNENCSSVTPREI